MKDGITTNECITLRFAQNELPNEVTCNLIEHVNVLIFTYISGKFLKDRHKISPTKQRLSTECNHAGAYTVY